jgi:hypothetical protein
MRAKWLQSLIKNVITAEVGARSNISKGGSAGRAIKSYMKESLNWRAAAGSMG